MTKDDSFVVCNALGIISSFKFKL